jgi:micrococcal nuclease
MIDFYRVICTRVIDGDTFVGNLSFGVFKMTLEDIHFRLMDVDTPERGEPNYHEATEFTAQNLEGKEFTVYLHKKDSFGRWLADVYLDGIHERFNDVLLKEGIAKKYEK